MRHLLLLRHSLLRIALAGAIFVPGAILVPGARSAGQTMGGFDPAFNSGHPAVVAAGPSGSATRFTAVARQRDGKLVVVGATDSGIGTGSGIWVIARYTTSGRLDSRFGTDGVVKLSLGGSAATSAVLIQPSDQRIVVGGTAYSGGNLGAEFVRLNPNGSLDKSFGGTGDVFVSRPDISVLATGTMARDPVGNLYLGGLGGTRSRNEGVIVSVTGAGVPNGWATGGILAPNTTSAGASTQFSGVAVSGGTVFYAGTAFTAQQRSSALVGAVNAHDGSPVSGFGSAGVYRFPHQNTAFNGLLLAGDGKLKAVGYGIGAGPGTGAMVASFNPSGAHPLDTGFGHGGSVVVGGQANAPNNGNAITAVNGTLFVAATSVLSNSSTQIGLVGVDERTGALATGVGPHGFRTYSIGAQSYSTAIADPNGVLAIVGQVEQARNGLGEGVVAALEAGRAGVEDFRIRITEISKATTAEQTGTSRGVTGGKVFGYLGIELTITDDGTTAGNAGVELSIEQNQRPVPYRSDRDLIPSDFGSIFGPLGPGGPPAEPMTTEERCPFSRATEYHPVGLGHPTVLHCYLVLEEPPVLGIPLTVQASVIPRDDPGYDHDPLTDNQSNDEHVQVVSPKNSLVGQYRKIPEPQIDGTVEGSGSAVDARTAGAVPNPVKRVQIAVVYVGQGARVATAAAPCRWLGGRSGRLVSTRATKGVCGTPVWLNASLALSRKGHPLAWSYRLDHPLPRGCFTVYSRSFDTYGLTQVDFSAKIGNRRRLCAR